MNRNHAPPKGIQLTMAPSQIAKVMKVYSLGLPLQFRSTGLHEWEDSTHSLAEILVLLSRNAAFRVKPAPPTPAPVQTVRTPRHSPEPWATFGKQAIDANQRIVAQCKIEENSERIVACVNFCRGVPTSDMTNLGTAGYPAYLWARELAARAATITVHGSFPGPKEFFEPADL